MSIEDTQPLDIAADLRRLATMDETIRAWRQRVADVQLQLSFHLAAKERFLDSVAPSPTYYELATHR